MQQQDFNILSAPTASKDVRHNADTKVGGSRTQETEQERTSLFLVSARCQDCQVPPLGAFRTVKRFTRTKTHASLF